MNVYNNLPDSELADWLANFNTVCIANAATLGLSPADLTAIASASATFATKLTARIAQENQFHAAVEDKNLQRGTSLDTVRLYAGKFYSTPAIPDPLFLELGLAVHDESPTPREPSTPLDLVVNEDPDGNLLKWKRNGNPSNATFLVQYQVPGGSWQILGVTNKVRFYHENAEPGLQISYRVFAQVRETLSLSSNVVTAYSEGSELSLAA